MSVSGSFIRTAIACAAGLVLMVCAVFWFRLELSGLDVSAPRRTLHLGETVQLTVTRKTWLGTTALVHPELTKYIALWESMAVVEPDGKVTAVGTWGEPEESTRVSAFNEGLEGTAYFSVSRGWSGAQPGHFGRSASGNRNADGDLLL